MIDWDLIPEAQFDRWQKRLEITELILDPSIDPQSKREAKSRYCEGQGVTERTLSNYVRRYRERGGRGLLFYRERAPSLRIEDAELRKKILSLVEELPSRSVPTLRRLLSETEQYAACICRLSNRTLYRFLSENGLGQKERTRLSREAGERRYHSFEAAHSLDLVQADARDGIWLAGADGKPQKTYLFVWLDDHSRKILYAAYYLDERLPNMEHSFKQMLLRWGLPLRVYVDGGRVYISRHFLGILSALDIKQLRHKPYQAQAKGKVEAIQKIVKHEFQQEAQRAGFRTLEELNSAFWAWSEMVYNRRIHSATGEVPDERFYRDLPADHRRVTDLEAFNLLFLSHESRTVSKYGKIKLYGNQYPVEKMSPGGVVQLRFDPFDLGEIHLYDASEHFLETTSPTKKVTDTAPRIPEESKPSPRKVSQAAAGYFARLRERHLKRLKEEQRMGFYKLYDQNQKENKDG